MFFDGSMLCGVNGGQVYEARDRRHGTLCAIKVSRKEFRSKGDRERYLHEVESVAGLEEHPNVVKYFRCWQQDSHFYIQMELCAGGTLRTLVDALQRPMPEEQVGSPARSPNLLPGGPCFSCPSSLPGGLASLVRARGKQPSRGIGGRAV